MCQARISFKGRHGASLQFQVPTKNSTQHTFANKKSGSYFQQ